MAPAPPRSGKRWKSSGHRRRQRLGEVPPPPTRWLSRERWRNRTADQGEADQRSRRTRRSGPCRVLADSGCDRGLERGPSFSYRWIEAGAPIGAERRPTRSRSASRPPRCSAKSSRRTQREHRGRGPGCPGDLGPGQPEPSSPPISARAKATRARRLPALEDTRCQAAGGDDANPAAANGRQACTSAQIGLRSGIGVTRSISEESAHCPDPSKLGSAEVTARCSTMRCRGDLPRQALRQPVRLAAGDLPGGRRRTDSGIVAKLAGKVEPNPSTGS